MLLDGLHIPLSTPFHPDGRLNLPKLAANVVRYSHSPAAGLIVLGPSSEPTLIADDETREVLRTVAESAAPEKVLIAGISRDSVHATLALANYARELNYDSILIGPPGVAATLTELLNYFHTIADAAPLPIILLNISTDLASEFATHRNIIGLLDTQPANPSALKQLIEHAVAATHEVTVTPVFAAVTRRMQRAAAIATPLVSAASLTGAVPAVADPPVSPLRTRTKAVGFQVIAAHTATMLNALLAGAVGTAPTFAAAAPQACYEVFAAWKDQDQPLAEEKQHRLREAAQLAEESPAALKYAADLNGYFGGLPRLPHLPLTAEQRAKIEQLMKPLRN
jgi:dihydrodipicolinate synthase/N-acetylneuraminate lyase